jgi:glyoxylase-like metal-dependent hydrolase (beta-lactamase superfamily II)
MTIRIECLPSGPYLTNTYLLMSSSSDDAVVVDPAHHSTNKINALLQAHGKVLKAIWITHSHWDHTSDCHELLAHHNVPVMVHRLDAENLLHPGSDGIPSLTPLQPIQSLTLLEDKAVVCIGTTSWRVLHTPGHSLGSICFYNAEEGILISGDTLFKGTMGNTSFPTSSPYLMGETLLMLCNLPSTTKVFPGHGPSTTIGNELSWMAKISKKLREDFSH